MPMQPSPIAETVGPFLPSLRDFILAPGCSMSELVDALVDGGGDRVHQRLLGAGEAVLREGTARRALRPARFGDDNDRYVIALGDALDDRGARAHARIVALADEELRHLGRRVVPADEARVGLVLPQHGRRGDGAVDDAFAVARHRRGRVSAIAVPGDPDLLHRRYLLLHDR